MSASSNDLDGLSVNRLEIDGTHEYALNGQGTEAEKDYSQLQSSGTIDLGEANLILVRELNRKCSTPPPDRPTDGRQVSGVKPDPRRGHFITNGFQLYDSGEYSISQTSCTAWVCAATRQSAIPKVRSAPPPSSACFAIPSTPVGSSTSGVPQTKKFRGSP